MPQVSEHNSKKKRKSDTSESSWVDFFIERNSVGVDDLRKGNQEGVLFEIGRWTQVFILNRLNIDPFIPSH